MKYIVTLDITVEAESREDAFGKVEMFLCNDSVGELCLYDAVVIDEEEHLTVEEAEEFLEWM